MNTMKTMTVKGKTPSRLLALMLALVMGLASLVVAPTLAVKAAGTSSPSAKVKATEPAKPLLVDTAMPFSNGFAAVEINGKWGVIDASGKLVVKAVWDSVELPLGNALTSYIERSGRLWLGDERMLISLIRQVSDIIDYTGSGSKNTYIKVRKDGKCGLVDKDGRTVANAVWDDIGITTEVVVISNWVNDRPLYIAASSDDMVPIKQGDKWGFINVSTNKVIQPQFDNASFFTNGIAAVVKNGKGYFIDKSGAIALSGDWVPDGLFIDGLATIMKGDKRAIINTKGEILALLECQRISPLIAAPGRFMASFKDDKDNYRFSLIDKYGKELFSQQKYPFNFHSGLSSVYLDGKWGFANVDGKIVVDCKWDSCIPFNGDKTIVCKDDKSYVINKSGKTLCKLPDSFVEQISSWVSVASTPNLLGGLKIDDLAPFVDKKDERIGFINIDGSVAIDYIYSSEAYVAPFVKGIAFVISEEDEFAAFIDKSGNVILRFDKSDDLMAYNMNMSGWFIHQGDLADLRYEWSTKGGSYFPGGMHFICKSGKFGYVDTKGKVVIAPQWDAAANFVDGFALVSKRDAKGNDTYSFIDTKGRVIVSFKER